MRYSIILVECIQPVDGILNHALGRDLDEALIGSLITTTLDSLFECVRYIYNASNVFIFSTYMYCLRKDMLSYFFEIIITMILSNVEDPGFIFFLNIYIYIPFFRSTFIRPAHAWIEWKLILIDLVRENFRPLIKI